MTSEADSTPVLAVDIGNTRTKTGLIDLQRTACTASAHLPTSDIGNRLLPTLVSLQQAAAASPPVHAVIAGVVRSATETARELLTGSGLVVHELTTSSRIPLAVSYVNPGTLGADRLANALYVATRFPDARAAVISAGTALTVDYIAESTFHGGAILPGLALQSGALHSSTDALPLVEFHGQTVPPPPGTSTDECILRGILHGTAAAVSSVVTQYRNRTGEGDLHIFTTGGDWPQLQPLVRFEHRFIPELTLLGIAAYPIT